MPKILNWDLETGLQLVSLFDLEIRGGYISHKSLETERYIICASFKEMNKKAFSHDISEFSRFKDDPTDDYFLVKRIRQELEDADVLVHHNGDRFDLRFLNARLAIHGFDPIPPDIICVDTCKLAKKKFKFNSNSLEYLAKVLGVQPKPKISGATWKKCMEGDVAAVKKMAEYNIGDVETLEQIYSKLAPFDIAKFNTNLVSDKAVCSHCGSPWLEKRGFRYTKTRKYQRYQCNECHGWSQSVKSEKDGAELK